MNKKIYNFTDPKLLPKISCHVPSADNYEITNLISDDWAIRNRGFLAYSFVKAPIHFDIEFLCPINLNYIKMITTIGNQKCTGIELLAKTTNMMNGCFRFGRCTYEKRGVIFCDKNSYSKDNLPPEYEDDLELTYFQSNSSKLLYKNLKSLRVIIFRTHKSVPCIKSIKIFATPSQFCSATTLNTIDRIINNVSNGDNKDTNKNEQLSNSNELNIPDEFKDDLTYELMTIPMTLPSGKSVDQGTLDKHIKFEENVGRKPGDPFTGLPFTNTRKPILNVALKSRIDMFLLRNSCHPSTFNLKRQLGSTYETSKRFRENIQNNCIMCKLENKILYVIPCNHLYCKECIFKLNDLKCSDCKRDFTKKDITKYNYS